MRFLIDENLPPAVAAALQAVGHEVRTISRSDEQGFSDEEVWRLAAAEDRIVITRDLDFPLPDLPHPRGLVLLRVPRWFLWSHLADFVAQELTKFGTSNLMDKIVVLAPGRAPRTRDF